ncbi:hypothetical protein EDC04DRAFT_2499253, partial [Pisolithus marmoratus]
VRIDVLQLLHDMKTCWDSIYYMMCHLHYLHPPIDLFLDRPNNKDMKKYRLSPMQWNVLRDFKLILEVCYSNHAFLIPHQAIHTLSSECLPTLCKYLITFEKFYDTWIRLGQD